MLDKVGEMENDPTAPKNAIEPPTEEELATDDTEVELDEYADIILEDDSFDESLPFGGQEFSFLNRQLDQLQSALDEIESRNAGIHKELLEILHSNREVRQNIKEEIVKEEPTGQSSATQSVEESPKHDEEVTTTSKADDLLSSTSAIAHLLNTVTQEIDKMSTS